MVSINKTIPETANCRKLSMCDTSEGVLVDMKGIYDEVGWEGEEFYNTGKDFGCIHFKNK